VIVFVQDLRESQRHEQFQDRLATKQLRDGLGIRKWK
jgi:hypothetical protein